MSRRVAAIAVLVAAWTPALASIVIAWMFRLPELPLPGVFLSASPPLVQSRFDDIGVVVAIIYGALSAVLIARRPSTVAVLLAVHAVGSGIAAFGVQWGLLGAQHPGLPLWGVLAHAAGWAYLPGTVATTIVPLLLLVHPLTPRARVVVAVGLGFAAVTTLAAFVHQAQIDPVAGGPVNPFSVPGATIQAALPWVYGIVAATAVALSAGVVVWIAVRRGSATGLERSRVGWLLIGHLFLTVSYAALVVPAGDHVPGWVWDFGMIAPVVGQIFYPSAVLVISLGAQLNGIDIGVSRALRWTILVVVAVVAYLAAGELLRLAGFDPNAAGIVAAGAVAVALQFVRRRIDRGVDRIVYGPEGDPGQLLRTLGERVGEFESGPDGLEGLAGALRGALGVGAVEILGIGRDAPIARAGERGGETHTVELRSGGARIGSIAIAARHGERLSVRAVRELEELAGVLATSVRLALASERLGAARDAVISARQDERRALRRELHDGIGPALAGVGFGLAAVDNLRRSDREAAAEFARRLAADLRDQLATLRRIARSMRPEGAVLELAAELGELGADFAGSGTEVRVQAPAAWRVPAEHARSVYLVAAEAVHNAVRHSGAGVVDIELVEDPDGAVALTVRDDGHGFDAHGPSTGVGLASMREHAAEAGASLLIRSGPTGTAVSIALAPRTAGAPVPESSS